MAVVVSGRSRDKRSQSHPFLFGPTLSASIHILLSEVAAPQQFVPHHPHFVCL
jgi:hypothetical protein